MTGAAGLSTNATQRAAPALLTTLRLWGARRSVRYRPAKAVRMLMPLPSEAIDYTGPALSLELWDALGQPAALPPGFLLGRGGCGCRRGRRRLGARALCAPAVPRRRLPPARFLFQRADPDAPGADRDAAADLLRHHDLGRRNLMSSATNPRTSRATTPTPRSASGRTSIPARSSSLPKFSPRHGCSSTCWRRTTWRRKRRCRGLAKSRGAIASAAEGLTCSPYPDPQLVTDRLGTDDERSSLQRILPVHP